MFEISADDHAPQRFLRLVPAIHRSREQVQSVATFCCQLERVDIRLASPLRSDAGALVESIDTEIGMIHACVVEGALGVQIEAEELSETRARAWGSALAQIHTAGLALTVELPIVNDLDTSVEGLQEDLPLSDMLKRLAESLRALPTTGDWWGGTHGDFELDNMAWIEDEPMCFDFDEAAATWYISDIANAVRDLTTMGRPLPEHRANFDGFIAGYRDVRDLPNAQLDALPLLAATGVARRLLGLRASLVVDPSAGAESGSLQILRRRLEQIVATDRQDLLDVGL